MQVTPRGVQLHLGTAQQPHQVDTLVMSNLGYYQLKAAPGVFNLRLAPGRSQELYTVVQPDTEPDTEVKVSTMYCLPQLPPLFLWICLYNSL